MDKQISVIASILMVMLFNSTSTAQHRTDKDVFNLAEFQSRRMEVTLNLTVDQLSEVSQINVQFMNQLKGALAEKENEEILTEAKVLRVVRDRNYSLSQVLTHDQMSALLLAESAHPAYVF